MAEYSKHALKIYERLYFLRDNDDNYIETSPEQTHKRVCSYIANDEEEYERFKYMFDEQIFRCNTPCFLNAGITHRNNHDGNLCACFVVGLEDSLISISEMYQTAMLIYSSGAGMGAHIGTLREEKAPLSTGGFSSGPISFLRVIQVLSDTVRSGGRNRRAANFFDMWYNHPDIIKFINCKSEEDLSAMNISVILDKQFFEALDKDATIDLISPTGHKRGSIKASEIWNVLISNAWKTGDPGCFFYDNVNKFNKVPSAGAITCSNPCGEVPLRDWSTCNLGSINTYKFIKNGKFDDEDFKEWIPWAVRFLDNVIDKTNYINDKFKKNMLQFRPVGLGIMGFADTCYELGLRYDSEEAISLLEHISKVLTKTAYEYSIDVVHSNEKTPAYIPPSDTKHFLNLLKHYEVDEEHLDAFIECGIRNTEVTCFAPTGSTALSADASYSFEPIFALSFKKTLVDTNEVMYITNKVFEKTLPLIAKEVNKDPKEILDDITSEQNKGSIQHIDYIPQKFKNVFVVAHDINPEKRIEIQGKAQNYITMAISSTVNLPNSATKEDVANIYKLAHKHGLKGITIYRDGCKDFQPIEFNKDSKKDNNQIKNDINERPIVRYGKTVEVKTSQGKLFLTGNYINDKVAEVFIRLSKQGSLVAVLTDALARCISKGLQHGVNIECYIDTLIDLQGETFWTKINPENDGNELVYSIPDAIAKILLYHFANGNNQLALEESLDPTLKMCPSCNRRGIKPGHGGCRSGSCIYCGYSACGG